MDPYRDALAFKKQLNKKKRKRQKKMLDTIYRNVEEADPDRALWKIRRKCIRGGKGDSVTIIRTASDDPDGNATLLSLLWQIFVKTRDENIALNAYFSFIYHMIPDQQADIVTIIEDNGSDVIFVEYPEEWEDTEFLYQDLIQNVHMLGRREFLVILCLCMIMPFKIATLENFTSFYKKMIITFSTLAAAKVRKIGLPFTSDKVQMISHQMNGFDGFRVLIIRFALSVEARLEAGFKELAEQLTRVLEWSDMTAFQMIREHLLEQESPVLFEPSVIVEKNHVQAALEALSEFDFPPFMRYLGPLGSRALFERNNFPTLYAVAQLVAADKSPSVAQLVMTKNVSSELVVSLLQLHQNYAMNSIIVPKGMGKLIPRQDDLDFIKVRNTIGEDPITDQEYIQMKRYIRLKSMFRASGLN